MFYDDYLIININYVLKRLPHLTLLTTFPQRLTTPFSFFCNIKLLKVAFWTVCHHVNNLITAGVH
jgi:hypothetical protein